MSPVLFFIFLPLSFFLFHELHIMKLTPYESYIWSVYEKRMTRMQFGPRSRKSRWGLLAFQVQVKPCWKPSKQISLTKTDTSMDSMDSKSVWMLWYFFSNLTKQFRSVQTCCAVLHTLECRPSFGPIQKVVEVFHDKDLTRSMWHCASWMSSPTFGKCGQHVRSMAPSAKFHLKRSAQQIALKKMVTGIHKIMRSDINFNTKISSFKHRSRLLSLKALSGGLSQNCHDRMQTWLSSMAETFTL